MAREMELLCVLLLLFTTALCDKKLNLEDIERDHIRSDINNSGGKKTTKDTMRNEESKYLIKAEVSSQSQQQYHGPTAPPQELGNQVGDYAELQSYGSFKYAQAQPYEYSQDNYQQSDNGVTYLQHNSDLMNPTDHHQSEQQHYVQEGRSNSQNDYDALQQQQQLYQQKVLMGNQLQTVQQEAGAHKYIDKNHNEGAYYMNIPTSQLLAYYQNYRAAQSDNKDSEQQISVPIYMPALVQNQVYTPTKVSYQPEVQYVSSYPKHTQVVFTKTPKRVTTASHASTSASSTNLAQQLPAGSQHQQSGPIDILGDEAYTSVAYKPQKYEYYVTQQQQPQPRYVHQPKQPQQLIYENSGAYADIYSTPSTAYVQDNSLFEQQQSQVQVQDQHNHLQHQQQQYYVPTSLAEQYMTQLLHQAGIQNTADIVQQAIKQTQESLHQDFTPPQYQAQKFRASHEVTHLAPVDSENEGFHSKPIYSSASVLSQPKTLLDSYVPSHVIAAQDANRYRERPIKLESGFLPSKINFIRSYKKRKTE